MTLKGSLLLCWFWPNVSVLIKKLLKFSRGIPNFIFLNIIFLIFLCSILSMKQLKSCSPRVLRDFLETGKASFLGVNTPKIEKLAPMFYLWLSWCIPTLVNWTMKLGFMVTGFFYPICGEYYNLLLEHFDRKIYWFHIK